MIHFDVMDNHYVPNLTFGPMLCKAIRDYGIDAPIDVHLMVEPVDDLIARFADAGASSISFHPEASRHIDRSIALIRDKGCSPGLVLNPASSLSLVEESLYQIDMLLFMSVNPGFGGQKFIPRTLEKIRRAREYIDLRRLPIHIEVDGGVGPENIAEIALAGADTFVAGSAIFGKPDYRHVIAQMRHALSQVARPDSA